MAHYLLSLYDYGSRRDAQTFIAALAVANCNPSAFHVQESGFLSISVEGAFGGIGYVLVFSISTQTYGFVPFGGL